jgi:hypothetical protein
MPTNNNTEVSGRIRHGLKINQAYENVPTRVGDVILPVFISNPERLVKWATATASDTSNATILTTSSTKNTFLVGCSLSVSKDAVGASTFSRIITSRFGGGTSDLFTIRYEPTTAGQFTESISFPYPVKLAKGATVVANNASGVASIDTAGTVYYFETEGEED